MDRFSAQVTLVSMEKLKTTDDIKEYITKVEKDIANVTNIRQKYRNKLRHCNDDTKVDEYKTKIKDCTTLLATYRRKLKIAKQILEDIPEIKENIQIERKMIKEEVTITKNKGKYL